MGKRKSSTTESGGDLPKKAKKEVELLVDPEKPWYLVKIREDWEVTGPRPGSATEVDQVQQRATKVYADQVALYQKRTHPALMLLTKCIWQSGICPRAIGSGWRRW